MPEPQSGERGLENTLLTKVYNGNKDQLEADIEAELHSPSGEALNRGAALQRLRRTKGQKELPGEHDANGWFTQIYHRANSQSGQERGFSAYLAHPQKGIQVIRFDSMDEIPQPAVSGLKGTFGEAQKWTGLKKVEYVISGYASLRASKGVTKIQKSNTAEIGKDLWNMSPPLTRITDGLGTYQAFINTIGQAVEEWENGRPKKLYDVLGNGSDAHLSIALTDKVDQKTGTPGDILQNVEIVNINQLQTLLGDLFLEDRLMDEKGLGDIRDSLRSTPVIVFGSGKTPQGDLEREVVEKFRVKKPKISIDKGPGLVVPYS
jgi:hypothetical protein